MRIDDGVLRWLTDELSGTAAADDFETTYSFDHECRGEARLLEQRVVRIAEPPYFKWRIEVDHPTGRPLLDPPLSRHAFADAPLMGGDATGAVVHNDACHVEPEFQRRGFATALYDAEGALFDRWGIVEIQMTAIEAGRVVWPKRFGFTVPAEARPFLDDQYRRWVEENPGAPPEPPESMADFPDTFLCSMPRIMLYRTLP